MARSTSLGGGGSRTLRNTALVLAARVVSRLLAFAAIVVIIRHLAAGGMGAFQFVVSVTGVVTVVLDLGFNTLFQREAARHRDQISRYLSNLISVRVLSALVALGVLSGILWAKGAQAYIVPGFLMMVLASYATLLRGTLYAVQRLGFEAMAIVLETVVLLGAVVYGAMTGRGAGYYLWAYAISYGFSCVYFVVVLTARRMARIGWRLEPLLVREWLWKGLPFALTFLITGIYFKVDGPILTFVRGYSENGYYAAAYKPFEALLFVPQTMLSVVFPVLAVLHRENGERVGWAVERFYKVLLLLGWPITIGTFMLTPAFRVVYSYELAAPALRVLAVGIVFMFVNNAFIGALNSADRQVSFTWAAFWSMVINLALNGVLIPLFGYMGAAVATVLTEIALAAMCWVLTARHLGRLPLFQLSWRIVVAGLVMGLVLIPLRDVTGWPALLVIAGAATVYGAAVLALRTFDAEEWAVVRRAVQVRT